MAETSWSVSPRAGRADRAATVALSLIAASVCLLLVLMVAQIVVAGAAKALDPAFLTGRPLQFRAGGGIGPEIFNSFYLLFLTMAISVPISIGAAIYLEEYAPDTAFVRIVKLAIETLSSLPSIVVGLFGFMLFVISLGWGFSILAGALALAVFNIPLLVRVMQQALSSTPRSLRDAGLALGLTRWECVTRIVLPEAIPALVTGVVLAAGRVFGEAAVLIYTAGQSAPALDFANFDLSSPSCPWNVMRPAETLAVHIWKINSEGVVPDAAAVSAGTAAVLVLSVLAFNLIARLLGRLLERRMTAQ